MLCLSSINIRFSNSSLYALSITESTLASSSFFPPYASPGILTGNIFGRPGENRSYDYVIVGGGLGGSTVATRLIENTNATVAVIEAGSFYEISNGNWSQIPYYSRQYVGAALDDWQPQIDWGLITVPLAVSSRFLRALYLSLMRSIRVLPIEGFTMPKARIWEEVLGAIRYSIIVPLSDPINSGQTKSAIHLTSGITCCLSTRRP